MLKITLFYGTDVYSLSMKETFKRNMDVAINMVQVTDQLAIELKILKIPQIRFYVDDTEVKRHVGSLDKETFNKILKQVKLIHD